jgi:hypothetical protein
MVARSFSRIGPFTLRGYFPAGSKIIVDDLGGWAIGNQLARVQQDGPVAQTRNR